MCRWCLASFPQQTLLAYTAVTKVVSLPPSLPACLPTPQATLSAKAYMRGDRFDPANPATLGFGAHAGSPSSSSSSSGSYRLPPTMAGRSRGYSGARAAYGDYPNYPEGRPIFLPEAERFGNPPDLPSLLLQQRVIYISMPVSQGAFDVVVFWCRASRQQGKAWRRSSRELPLCLVLLIKSMLGLLG